MSYHELSIEERIQIQLGQLQGLTQRAIARMLDRSPSTISRELRRNAVGASKYSKPSPTADAPSSNGLPTCAQTGA